MEWILRPVFGLLLAGVALAAMIEGGVWFAAFIALAGIAGLREWHRMHRRGAYFHYVVVGALAVAVALGLLAAPLPDAVSAMLPPTPSMGPLMPALVAALAALAAGAVIDAILAAATGNSVPWQAAGPIYLGVGCVALFTLRATADHGLWLVLLLFLAVWAADTGALVSGKLIGGPKLAPVLSPNKTWAGFVGGIMVASATAAAAMAILGASAVRGAVFGGVIALVAHFGDLFESWVKRRVGRKNSGHLIPGHGGVLDRIDSILFAAPAFAALVFIFGAHSILGAYP